MIHSYRNYRQYLQDELDRRMSNDPHTSLRSFSKQLALSRTSLSDILRGKANLSAKRAAHVAAKLGLSHAEAGFFVDLVTSANNKNGELRTLAQRRLERDSPEQSRTELENDSFHVISDWQHFAILELIETSNVRCDIPSIAKRLRLSPLLVSSSLARLQRLDLLRESETGFIRTKKNINTKRDVPSAAVRKHNQQHLELAKLAIEKQSVAERNYTTMTMAIDPQRLIEAKEMIHDFVNRLTNFLESGDRTAVYTFNTQLFRIDIPDHPRGEKA